MDWGSLLGAGLGLFGQSKASDAATDAAKAQVTSAAIAAEAGKFKPYGVTTGFGSSYFDPEKGTAGYDLDPALAAYRDKLMMMGAEGLPQDLSQTPQQAAQEYMKGISGMGGPTSTIANRYGKLAGQAKMPTNVGDAYAGISGPQYSGLAGNVANQYAKAGSNLLGQETASAGDLYDQIRGLQRPEEARQRSSMEQGLFGKGRLGMKMAQYGGTPEQLAFEKAMGENRNEAAYQAINQADQLAASQRQQAMGLSQMGMSADQVRNSLATQGFQNQMGLAGANLSAQQAQAQLFGNLQQSALGAYNSQLQQGAMARAGGMSELDQAIARGTGLFTSGMGVEQLGLTPLQLGASLGAKQSTAGIGAGNTLMTGATNAANANMAAGVGWANTLSDIGAQFSNYNWK